MKLRWARSEDEAGTAAVPPVYAYPGDLGADLTCVEEVTLTLGELRDVRTGIHLELPLGVGAAIESRSSTLRRRGLFVVPGFIDQGYRGELLVGVRNEHPLGIPVTIKPGDRLAQFILKPVIQPVIEEVKLSELAESVRGTKGFGSTGTGGVIEPAKLPPVPRFIGEG